MPREMVTMQLRRDGRPIGREISAYLERPLSGRELAGYLKDAVEREHYHPSRVGEFLLEVRDSGNGRWLVDFAGCHDDGRRR